MQKKTLDKTELLHEKFELKRFSNQRYLRIVETSSLSVRFRSPENYFTKIDCFFRASNYSLEQKALFHRSYFDRVSYEVLWKKMTKSRKQSCWLKILSLNILKLGCR